MTSDLTPPNISGLWKTQDWVGLTQKNYPKDANIKDVYKIENLKFEVDQKNNFVTFKQVGTNVVRPVAGVRLGIWKPTLLNGRVSNWELLLSDYDDINLTVIQVLKVNKNNDPKELLYTLLESGRSKSNPNQSQSVGQLKLVRECDDICH